MIRILRPATVPKVLATHGRRLLGAYIAQYSQGDVAFVFDRDVYGHAEVKRALRRAQHDKCGFCESKVSHVAFGDVEHFRPKAAYRGREGDPLTSPGYFWLAYEWTNLLFACEPCNQRHKGSLFPVADEATRAHSPSDPITRESPLFIDPGSEDPTLHIGFREEFPYAIGGGTRGESTWRSLGLDRPALLERRREHLQRVRSLRKAVRLLKRNTDKESRALVREIEGQLRHCVEDNAEYAAATRCMLSAAPTSDLGDSSRRGTNRLRPSPHRAIPHRGLHRK